MIYILEDDTSIRKLVVYTLQSQGMEAQGFDRPSQFWEAMEKGSPEPVSYTHLTLPTKLEV